MMSLNNSFCSLYRKNVSFEDENSPEDGYSGKFQQEKIIKTQNHNNSLAAHIPAVAFEQQKDLQYFNLNICSKELPWP